MQRRRQDRGRVYRPRPLRVPPPDSTIWPEQYRGAKWKRAYGVLFEGKCQLCAYSFPPSQWRQAMDRCSGMTRLLLCTNRPDSPGELQEVLPIETCRNFKCKRWTRRPTVPAQDRSRPPCDETDPTVRRIILSNGMIATVDAADYPRLSRHRWYANRHGRSVYACTKIRGKPAYMHHLVLRPTRGHVIDHMDRNGLNNRSSNLRETTMRQNLLNRRPPSGSSRLWECPAPGTNGQPISGIAGNISVSGSTRTRSRPPRPRPQGL